MAFQTQSILDRVKSLIRGGPPKTLENIGNTINTGINTGASNFRENTKIIGNTITSPFNDNKGIIRMDPQGTRRITFGKQRNDDIRAYAATLDKSTDFLPFNEAVKIAASDEPLLAKSNRDLFGKAAKETAWLALYQGIGGAVAPALGKVPVLGKGLQTAASNPVGLGLKNMANPLFYGLQGTVGYGLGKAQEAFFDAPEGTASRQVAETLGRAPGLAFGLGVTGPILQSIGPHVDKIKNPVARQIVGRLASGTANVVEGIGFDKLVGMETTPTSIAIDMITGNVMVKSNIGSDLNAPITKPVMKVLKDAVREVGDVLRNTEVGLSTKEVGNIMSAQETVARAQQINDTISTTQKQLDRLRARGGSENNAMVRNLTKVIDDLTKQRTQLSMQAAERGVGSSWGLLFGFEFEEDENGTYKYKGFNEEKAMAGLLLTIGLQYGVRALKNTDTSGVKAGLNIDAARHIPDQFKLGDIDAKKLDAGPDASRFSVEQDGVFKKIATDVDTGGFANRPGDPKTEQIGETLKTLWSQFMGDTPFPATYKQAVTALRNIEAKGAYGSSLNKTGGSLLDELYKAQQEGDYVKAKALTDKIRSDGEIKMGLGTDDVQDVMKADAQRGLIQEARKYKSAEEFVKANIDGYVKQTPEYKKWASGADNIVEGYHGTPYSFDEFKLPDESGIRSGAEQTGGISFATKPQNAEPFSRQYPQSYYDELTKIRNKYAQKAERSTYIPTEKEVSLLRKELKKVFPRLNTNADIDKNLVDTMVKFNRGELERLSPEADSIFRKIFKSGKIDEGAMNKEIKALEKSIGDGNIYKAYLKGRGVIDEVGEDLGFRSGREGLVDQLDNEILRIKDADTGQYIGDELIVNDPSQAFIVNRPQFKSQLTDIYNQATKSIEGNLEEATGWKPGQRERFDTALITKDINTIKKMLPDVPVEYKARFQTKIDEILSQPTLKIGLGAKETGDIMKADAQKQATLKIGPQTEEGFNKAFAEADESLQATKEIPTVDNRPNQPRPAFEKQTLSDRELEAYAKSLADEKSGLKKKVGIVDKVRTPDRVLRKMGLGEEVDALRKADDNYKSELRQEILKMRKLRELAPSEESSRKIFQYLDGKKVELTEPEQKVADTLRPYLAEWADRLGLAKDRRILNYITHLFEQGIIEKEFDPELAKIMRDKVPGSVYDPFLEKRLGKQGYIEDVWRAMDAYIKRSTRKYHMDPVLDKISAKADGFEATQWNYMKRYIDSVNMRPTELDELIDNSIKQSPIGYRFGQRPVTSLSQKWRQNVFRAALWFNPATVLKNLTQGVNTYSVLGEKYTALGYADLLRKSAANDLDDLYKYGILDDDIIQDRGFHITKSNLEKMDKYGFALFDAAEKINRGSTFYGALRKAISEGSDEEAAVNYARKVVRDTQFVYGALDRPQLLQSDISRTLGQFMTFPIKQTEFLAELAQNKEWGPILRYIAGSYVASMTIGKLVGMDMKDFIPFSDGRFETPIMQAAGTVKDLVSTDPEKREQGKRDLLGKTGAILVPGGVQARKTFGGLKVTTQGYSESTGGRIRTPVDQSTGNKVRAAILGPYQLPEVREYFDKERDVLGEKQSEVFKEKMKTDPEEARKYYNKIMKAREVEKGIKQYEESSDAPKTDIGKQALGATSFAANTLETIQLWQRGEPIRKMTFRGDNAFEKAFYFFDAITVSERAEGVSKLDKGDTTTQVDHIIPKWLGGREDPENYQILTVEEHEQKTNLGTRLREQYEAGDISKDEAKRKILEFNKSLNGRKISTEQAEDLAAEAIVTPSGKTYSWTDGNGNVKQLSIEPPVEPTYTGNELLDKKLKSKYKGKITTAGNNIIKLYEAGTLTAEEAESALAKLEQASTKLKSSKKGGKGRKGRKVSLGKVSIAKAPKLTVKFGKLPSSKTRKRPSLSLKSLKVADKEYRIKA